MNGNYGGSSHTMSYTRNDSAFVVLQNCLQNTLDIYNIEQPKWVRSMDLSFMNSLCGKQTSCFYGSDTLLCITSGSILFSTFENDFQTLSILNDNESMKGKRFITTESFDTYEEIHLTRDSILLFPVYYGNYKKRCNQPITATYNLRNGEIGFADINYPNVLCGTDYGLLDRIEHYYFDETILYAFHALPEIWKYNIQTSTLQRYNCKSTFHTDSILPITFKRTPKNKDLLFDHFMHSARYERLVYDKYKKCYYRFFVLQMSHKNEQGLFNTYKDRRMSLMVLDENFNLIGETLLPKNCLAIFFAVASKQGLFVNNGPLTKAKENGWNILKINFTVH